jgi:ATP-binding cassette subfamily B protein
MSGSSDPKPRLVRRVAGEVGPYWKHLMGLFFLSLVATPLALLTPVPLMLIVDNVLGNEPLPGWLTVVTPSSVEQSSNAVLLIAVILLVATVLLRELQGMATTVAQTSVGEHLTLRFRSHLLAAAQAVSFAFHDARGSADTIYRIQYDARAIELLAVYALIPQVVAVVTFVAMMAVIALIDVQLALLALAIAPLFVLYQRYFRKRMRPRYTESKRIDSHAMHIVHEQLGAFRVVKAFGQEDNERHRFVRQAERGVEVRIRLARAEAAFFLLVSMTTAIGTAAVLYVGTHSVESGRISLGDLLLVIGYLGSLYAPLQKLTNAAANIQNHLASAERAFELLDAVPDVEDRPDARPLRRAHGAFALEHVDFAYESDKPVLKGMNLEIPSGCRLGIAGRTGSGKTTLVSLLSRFYDPGAGVIRLDGIDLREYRLKDLRAQFSIVLQEPVLFSTSIRENIAYARPDAGIAEIHRAAIAANAHEFISALPDGYDTLVGERGMRLSGGERQRISLARAFLRDAPILIMDEPTSSVDLDTEEEIMTAAERLMAGRTVLLIAHRLSTLTRCDAVLSLADGRATIVAPPSVTDSLVGRLTIDQLDDGQIADLQSRVEIAETPPSPCRIAWSAPRGKR